jgi:hypothetical protein
MLRRVACAALRCSASPHAAAPSCRSLSGDALSETRKAYEREVSTRRRQWAAEQAAARAAVEAARRSRRETEAAERAVRKAAQAETARLRRLELDALEAVAAKQRARPSREKSTPQASEP